MLNKIKQKSNQIKTLQNNLSNVIKKKKIIIKKTKKTLIVR